MQKAIDRIDQAIKGLKEQTEKLVNEACQFLKTVKPQKNPGNPEKRTKPLSRPGYDTVSIVWSKVVYFLLILP